MSKPTAHILSVGNCGFDHRSLVDLFSQHFGAEVHAAHSAADALKQLERRSFDLVLVNRQFDRDGDSGLDLIRRLKAEARFADTTVMLLSNYANYQQQAVDAGAAPGFGKAGLRSPETLERLRQVLTTSKTA